MAFMGEIRDIGVADLLYLLALRQQSGRLSVVASSDEVSMYIDQGRMILVTSSNPSLRLGRMLVRLGYMDDNQLREALKFQDQHGAGRPLGKILIDRGFVTDGQLRQCVEEQCIESISRVIAEQTGVFVFHRGERVSPLTEIVPLNPDRILLEATRRTDELSSLKSLLPDEFAHLMLSANVDTIAEELNDVEIQIATVLYRSPITLRELVMLVPVEDAVLWRAVISMRQRGLIVSESLTPVGAATR